MIPAVQPQRSAVVPSRAATVGTLLVGDLIAAGAAVAVSGWVATWTGIPLGIEEVLLLLSFMALAPAAFAVAGLYPGIGVSKVDELRLLSLYTTSVFVALLPAVAILRGFADLSLGIFTWAVALVTIPVVRGVVREIGSAIPWWGVPVVVLGAGRAGSALVHRLQRDRRAGLRVVAAFDDDPRLMGMLLHGVPIAGTLADSDLFAEDGVRTAIVALPSADPHRLRSVIRTHARRFPSLIVVPDIVGLGSYDSTVCSFDGMMAFRVRQNLLVRRNLILKRIMDLLLLVPASIFALPVIGLAALLIRLVNPGNPFYAQERVGMHGVPFKVWKLRTMYLDAEERLARHLAENPEAREEWYTRYKLTHDARILPGIGTFLRVSSLDELPQLWNIALGQMSFVGPRPFPAYHAEAFDEDFRKLRTQVAPGLTGLWQVTSRSDSDLGIQKELDSLYIANWSPWMDIYLLGCTPRAVVRGHGAV